MSPHERLRVQIRGPPPKLPSVVRFELVEEAWAAISEGKKLGQDTLEESPEGWSRDRVWRDQSVTLRAHTVLATDKVWSKEADGAGTDPSRRHMERASGSESPQEAGQDAQLRVCALCGRLCLCPPPRALWEHAHWSGRWRPSLLEG